MPCYSPLTAWQTDEGSIVFAERGRIMRQLQLPCGQCIGCRLQRAHNWAVRCMHEKKMHRYSSFITLTYDDAHLPDRGMLDYRAFQLFMKRFRKAVSPVPLRFYMSGEYGEQNWRPHYHAIIFGYDFHEDRKFWKMGSNKDKLYRSPLLERLWPYGFSLVGDVTYESCNYVARYCVAKVTGKDAEAHYARVDERGVYSLPPEFNQMSRKPGIGATFIQKFHTDVYPSDEVIVRGKQMRVPKYYDKWFKENFPLEFEEVQFKRETEAKKYFPDQSEERQAVKAEVAAARLAFKKRLNI